MRRPIAAGGVTVLLAVLLTACFGAGPSATAGAGTPTPRASQPASVPPSPSASPSASVAAGPLTASTYARVKVDGLRIRVAAKANATAVGALFFSDVVRIRADAGIAGGYHWYEIETVQTANDLQLTGFIAGSQGGESYLEPMSGPPSATPTRSASPSAVASATRSP